MFYLLLSVVSSGAMVLLFKAFERFGADTFRCLIVNYITASLWCNLMAVNGPVVASNFWTQPWFSLTVFLGILFIGIFYASALTAQRIAVSVSIVASKMSVVITVLWVSWFMGQRITPVVWIGIAGALAAVWLTTRRSESSQAKGAWFWLLPAVVFLGSGIVDSSLKYLEQTYFVSGDVNEQLGVIFMIAGVCGVLILGVKKWLVKTPTTGKVVGDNANHRQNPSTNPSTKFRVTTKGMYTWKPILGGAALGSLNYLSTFTLLKTLNLGLMKSHEVFPVINVAVVAFTSVMGVILFKEKLSRTNIIGIVLAMVFIGVIAWGSGE